MSSNKTSSAIADIKNTAKGIHGAGETIRGTFNQAVDETFKDSAGQAKNQAVVDKGASEIRAGETVGQKHGVKTGGVSGTTTSGETGATGAGAHSGPAGSMGSTPASGRVQENWFDAIFLSPPKQTATTSTSTEDKRILELPQQSQPAAPASTTTQPQDVTVTQTQPKIPRNVVITLAGASFFAFSLLITRRSFARKRLANLSIAGVNTSAAPLAPKPQVSGALEALEALNIATVNVLSLAMMSSGAALWYFGINSMDDARRKLRGGLGVDGTGRDEQGVEEEFEEWMATVLARRDRKEAEMDTKSVEKRFNERGKER